MKLVNLHPESLCWLLVMWPLSEPWWPLGSSHLLPLEPTGPVWAKVCYLTCCNYTWITRKPHVYMGVRAYAHTQLQTLPRRACAIQENTFLAVMKTRKPGVQKCGNCAATLSQHNNSMFRPKKQISGPTSKWVHCWTLSPMELAECECVNERHYDAVKVLEKAQFKCILLWNCPIIFNICFASVFKQWWECVNTFPPLFATLFFLKSFVRNNSTSEFVFVAQPIWLSIW